MLVRRSQVLPLVACLLPAAHAAQNAPVRMDGFSQGIAVHIVAGRPVVEIALPDMVYRTVTRADLGDVRVFNAEGLPVPHALCPAAETPPMVSWVAVPVVELREARRANAAGARVDVRTAAGTHIDVQESGSGPARRDAGPRAHVIDLRAVEQTVRALQFEWTSPDGASEAQVRIDASEDLDRWQAIVGSSTLLDAGEGGERLQRQRIPLPPRPYRYLRVERIDGGEPLEISSARAERVVPVPETEPVWFIADPRPAEDPQELPFDAGRLAPVRYARLRLAQDNTSVQVELQSRPVETAVWRTRWSGEMYLVVADTERRMSPPASFDATTDRYWRALLLQPEPPLSEPPLLELGYRPHQLRFLAQGEGPYVLAYGSRRADISSAVACSALLADIAPAEKQRLIAEGSLGVPRILGGDAALRPPPRKTPVRLFVLWGVLIVGVALLVTMAVTLLQRLKSKE